MESTDINDNQDVQRLADQFIQLFPRLDGDSRAVAIQIYRLLAMGEPVEPAQVAGAAGVGVARVEELLAGWPGVFFEHGRIIGFWGLTIKAMSKHLLKVGGRTLYTWCAWDTLFIPRILGQTAQVETQCPVTEEVIRLTVSPQRVEPEGGVMSMLEPPQDMLEDIVAKLCHFIFFFRDAQAGAHWTADHPGTLLMSINDGFELGRLKNEGRFGSALPGL
jgi:alkylmercury lyase